MSRPGPILMALLLGASTFAAAAPPAAAPPAGARPAPERGQQREAYLPSSLAQQALLSRDYSQALELLERAAARDVSPALLLELAQLRFSLNDLDGAADLLDRLRAEESDDAEAHKLLADIHLTRAREGIDTPANVVRAIEQYRAALRVRPDDADATRALAELYYHTGRLEEAADLLTAKSRRGGLDPPLALLLGKIQGRLGNDREAEEILAELAVRSPGNLEVIDALASLFEQQGKFDAAIAVFNGMLKGGTGKSAYVQGRLGSLHLQAGRPAEAIRHLEASRALDPDDVDRLVVLARGYEAAGRAADALARYDEAIAADPAALEPRFHKGRLQHREGDAPAALRTLQSVIDRALARAALTEREAALLALSYTQIGLLRAGTKAHKEAADAFKSAIDTIEDPDVELFLLLARARLDAGDVPGARAAIADGEKGHPGDLDLRVFEGEVRLVSGDGAGGRRHFEQLLKESDWSVEAYGRIGEALLRHKLYGEADRTLLEGSKRHPKSDALLFARGAAVERLGRVHEAETLLDQAIRLNPKNAMALNYLGYMLAERGLRLKDSISYVERALEIDPNNAAYLDSLGWAQFKMALFTPAEKNLRAAARYDGADPTIREHLGDLLIETGRPDEAVRQWEQALAAGHEDPDKVRAKISKARRAAQAAP